MSAQPLQHSMVVIVPAHQTDANLSACVASLLALQPAPQRLVLVWDGPAATAPAAGQLAVVETGGGGGPSAARNRGAAGATEDVLVFFDSDVTVPPDILARIDAAFCADPGLDALIGSYDDTPGDAGFLSQYRNLLHHYTHQHASQQANTFWGACGAIRREAFVRLGGFDERLRTIEDIDLGYRLRQMGGRMRLVADLQVKHMKRWTLRSMLYTDIFIRALPWTRLILRYRRMDNDLNINHAGRWSVALAWLALMAIAAGIFWLPALPVGVACLALMLAINSGVLVFLRRKRGQWFALRSAVMLWLFHLYGGAAFAWGVVEHGVLQVTGRLKKNRQPDTLKIWELHGE